MSSAAQPMSRRARRRAARRALGSQPGTSGGMVIPVSFVVSGATSADFVTYHSLYSRLAAYNGDLWIRRVAVRVTGSVAKRMGKYAFFEGLAVDKSQILSAAHARPYVYGLPSTLSLPGGRRQVKDFQSINLFFLLDGTAHAGEFAAGTFYFEFEGSPNVDFPRDSEGSNQAVEKFYLEHINA
ncbi:capsid protein [Olive latent virus 2]|uniref:Capsid protein n=1 Tax=Olive latent virus 2 (isolate Italy) TaxID=650489 RepID=CAPSD_OLV2I|nr:capsid protein [Olive latent virus 2]Q9YNE2.1 RecName: Full=Capsid protein; Short=CP; AltName: Full=Coat protein [Olive latent virus 2 isolate Italy]CAA54298.1 capsid protein [Olive latent virus 2]prf//2109364B ORF 20K [Olive latent virus 2]